MRAGLLSEIVTIGYEILLDGDAVKLHYKKADTPPDTVRPLIEELRKHKAEVVNILKMSCGNIGRGEKRTPAPEPFKGAARLTWEGECFWFITEPEDVKLIPDGEVFFLEDEITELHKAGKKAARAVLEIKRAFGSEARVIKATKH